MTVENFLYSELLQAESINKLGEGAGLVYSPAKFTDCQKKFWTNIIVVEKPSIEDFLPQNKERTELKDILG